MDRVVKKKKWSRRRITTLALAGVGILLAVLVYKMLGGGRKLNVDADRITVSDVRMGNFQEYIPVNGVVLPVTTIYLDALEGGRVEERYVEDGAVMKKDQPILRLSNTDLELSLVNQQTSVYNLLTQMQISANAAQQNTVSKLNQAEDVESQLKEAERIYKLNQHLFAEKVIGSQEFRQSENNYQYLLHKQKLSNQVLQQDSVSNLQQQQQARQSYLGSQNALSVMQKKVGDLIVRAPVDGQLTSLDAEIGQSKHAGDRLGQIDVLSGFKVRVEVDEHYISRIYTGLTGTFSFADTIYKLQIKKVYTQVTAGRFQVDMEFDGPAPHGIRRGQSLQIRLALSDETRALIVNTGGFYQQTAGKWVFKLNGDGTRAYRVPVQLGRQNTDYFEVLQGLQAGDRIITSSYENYGDMDELILKK